MRLRQELLALAKGGDPEKYEGIFKSLFDNDLPSELREIGVYGLFHILKNKNDKFRKIAESWISDHEVDFDLRSKASMSLSSAFSSTSDLNLGKTLYYAFLNTDDAWLKTQFLSDLLNVFGISNKQQLRDLGFIENSYDSLIKFYKKEIKKILDKIGVRQM